MINFYNIFTNINEPNQSKVLRKNEMIMRNGALRQTERTKRT